MRYADGLFALFDLLAKFPEMACEREEFTPPVRIHPSGSHLVIYRREGQGVEIMRILHAHQSDGVSERRLTGYSPAALVRFT